MAGKEQIVNQADQPTEKHGAEAGDHTQAQCQSRDPRQRQWLTLVAVHQPSIHGWRKNYDGLQDPRVSHREAPRLLGAVAPRLMRAPPALTSFAAVIQLLHSDHS